MKNFSVLILTYNEEINILECLHSVKKSNDIVVLDSLSTDQTKAFAETYGARVFEREFTNYSEQRNFGLHNIPYENEYLLILDADERASEELIDELFTLCNYNPAELHPVYLVRRRVYFMEKILRWNLSSSIWIERLVRPQYVSYYGNVHEKLQYEGTHGFLKKYIIHHQFSKGIANWLQRRKRYAQLEFASEIDALRISSISNRNISRRTKMRNFFINYVPLYYLLYFAFNVCVKMAFLDGIKGLRYITLETYSLYLISKYKKHAK